MLLGGTVVTTSKLGMDPDRLLGMVEEFRVTDLVIVGDAFARPLLNSLDGAKRRGTPYDISSLKQIGIPFVFACVTSFVHVFVKADKNQPI